MSDKVRRRHNNAVDYGGFLGFEKLMSVVLLLLISSTYAELLSEPSLRWSLQLEGSGKLNGRGLRKGNAIISSDDGTKLFVTADDGSLHIIQTTLQIKTIAIFEPDSVENKFTECRSGPIIVKTTKQSNNVEDFSTAETGTTEMITSKYMKDFIVYAVIDSPVSSDIAVDEEGYIQPNSNEDSSVSSRLIAVSMDGRMKWSVDVPGRIEGNVLVGRTGFYVSHNIAGKGYISVTMVNEEGSSADLVATLTAPTNDNGSYNVPFGPPALQRLPGWAAENWASPDTVIVAESWGQGFMEGQGGLYMLSATTEFQDTGGRGNESYRLQKISSWPYSAIVPPLVDGTSVFLGGTGGNLAGWTGNDRNDLSGIASGSIEEIEPRWVYQVQPSSRNESQPFLSPPAIDSAGELLLLAGVDNDLYCLQSNNGREFWSDTTTSQIMARPQIWQADDAAVVYVIESMNGRIRQHDLYTGERFWDYSCADIDGLIVDGNELCQDAVEAEFALAPSGNVIYYGDVFGRITSLEIARYETEAPTSSPTGIATNSPTQRTTISPMPSDSNGSVSNPPLTSSGNAESDILDPVTDETNSLNSQQQEQEDGSKNIGLYIGAAIGALCVLLIPIVIFSLIRGKRNKKDGGEEMLVEIIDDISSDDNTSGDRSAEDLESQDTDSQTDESSPHGIEIEYNSSKSVSITASKKRKRKKKKKKGKKSSPQTPQTVQTLESIEELPEESLTGVAAYNDKSFAVLEDDDGEDQSIEIEAVNLGDTFAMIASEGQNLLPSEKEEANSEDSPVIPGEVGVPPGSNHLELAVDTQNNLIPLHPDDEGSTTTDEDDSPSDEESRAPTQAALASSGYQWSWSSLLNMGTVHITKKSKTSKKVTTNQQVVLRPIEGTDSNRNRQSMHRTTEYINASHDSTDEDDSNMQADPSDAASDQATFEVARTMESPRSSDGSDFKQSNSDILSEDVKDVSSPAFPAKDQELTPQERPVSESPHPSIARDEKIDSVPQSPFSSSPPKISALGSMSEEEKKESEDSYTRPRTPSEASRSPCSSANESEQSSDVPLNSPSNYSGPSLGLPNSPSDRSTPSAHPKGQFSPCRSPSNVSTDDSLYTSATGMTKEKQIDTSNLSPLSTHLFDKEIHRRERSDLPADEARGILGQPDLSKTKHMNDLKFQYLDNDEDSTAEENVVVPGFQYMAKHQEEKGGKYGKSVRSKRGSGTFKNGLMKQNSFGSIGSDSDSPLTAMYNQLAAMGQQEPEKKKHSFKRRSKRGGDDKEEMSGQESEPQQEGDTWSTFLNELAEAEKQFFAPASGKSSSLLHTSESIDSEDSEVASINNKVK